MKRCLLTVLLALGGVTTIGAMVVIPASRLLHIHMVDRPILFEVPGSYQGWIQVAYEDTTCSPLRGRGLFLVVRISRGGHGCTPTPLLKGWRYFRFVRVFPDGTRKRAEGHIVGSDPLAKHLFAFIGPKAQMQPEDFPSPL